MKMHKRLLAMLLALVLAVSLVACGTTSNGKEEDKTLPNTDKIVDEKAPEADKDANATSADDRYDSVVIGINTSIDALDPGDPNGGCKPQIGWNIYESLFDIDGFGGEMYPVLAKGYTVVDELHYQVELYDYIVDSARNELHANDVVFSYQLAMDAGTNTVLLTYIESVEAIDENTVEFTWTKEPTAVGDLEAMFAKVWVFTQAAYESSSDGFATNPIATGPYVVTSFVAGASCTLEANENYWQTDDSLVSQQHKRNVQTIRFDNITESAQMVVALQTGKIDYAEKIAYTSLTDFADGGKYADRYDIDMYQDNQIYLLTPNCSSNSPCMDQNLRLALFYAVDTEQLCAAINGDATPLSTFANSNYSEYADFSDQDNYVNVCNIDLAKDYLSKANYDGTPLKMLLTNDETTQNVGQVLQLIWEQQLGVKVEFLTYDRPTVKEYKEADDMWDLCLESRGSTDYAITYLKGMFDTSVKHSAMWVSGDDELQALITALQTVDGHNAETYAAFHNHVIENAYEMPLFSTYTYGVYNSVMTGICKTAKNYILPGGCTYVAD